MTGVLFLVQKNELLPYPQTCLIYAASHLSGWCTRVSSQRVEATARRGAQIASTEEL